VKDIFGESTLRPFDALRQAQGDNIGAQGDKDSVMLSLSKHGTINTIFIATRHDSHAVYVLKALEAGKHVFIEKPLCITESQLEEIKKIYSSLLNSNTSAPILMVGFNRRFSPLTVMLKEKLGDGPMAMTCRVNAGRIPQDSWIQDLATGGGRIIGEICHFVDLLTFINGSLPISVYAQALPDPHHLNDTLTVTLTYSNGSIGTIAYFSNGPKGLPKEYIEVYSAGSAGIIRDFKEIEIASSQKTIWKKLWSQDKGQKRMVQSFIGAILKGKATPISFEDIYTTTLTTFKILESLRTGQAIRME
jgi:predicted dehydrogenase